MKSSDCVIKHPGIHSTGMGMVVSMNITLNVDWKHPHRSHILYLRNDCFWTAIQATVIEMHGNANQ